VTVWDRRCPPEFKAWQELAVLETTAVLGTYAVELHSLHFDSINCSVNATIIMRLLQWALLGITGAVVAQSNTTGESRNILTSPFTPPQHFRNVNLVRNINLEKSYPRETINVVIENVDQQAQAEYFVPFEQGLIGRVGGLEVKDKKDPGRKGFSVDVVGIDPFR
jgi:hypothetical protein